MRRQFAISQAWLELTLTGIASSAAAGRRPTAAEPKKLRYRLLHVAVKLSRTAHTTTLRIAANWLWTTDLVRAFERLAALP